MGPLRDLSGRDRALAWFAGLGGATAWGVHFASVYWYAEAACNNETAVASVEPVVLALTVVFAAIAAATGIAGLSLVRRARSGRLPDPRERIRFMAIAGMIASMVFGFAIVLEGIQVLALPSCDIG